jgi:oligoribonuclease
MPKLTAHLHPYRIVDVSTLKELINRWYAGTEELSKMPEKKNNHLALDDIRESIAELDFYRKQFFVAPQMPAKPSD